MDTCTRQALETINAKQIERLDEEATVEAAHAEEACQRSLAHGKEADATYRAFRGIAEAYTTLYSRISHTHHTITCYWVYDEERTYRQSWLPRQSGMEHIDEWRRNTVSDDVWALVKPEAERLYGHFMDEARVSREEGNAAVAHENRVRAARDQIARLKAFNAKEDS